MTSKLPTMMAPGPFRADQIREGSYLELSNGHQVQCMPTGRRGGRSNLIGGEVLETDPAVQSAGVDVGFSRDPGHLRAPDVSVGSFANEPGWDPDAPPLAVEYADTGQDEAELKKKIAELLGAGTKHVWVVRLTGPRRVEIHEKNRSMRLAKPGEELLAPGILKNPVPVEALFDREAAHEATLRNLLQRRGYESLDAVLATGIAQGEIKGKIEGKIEAILGVLRVRGRAVSAEEHERIRSERDVEVLDRWLAKAVSAATTEVVLGGGKRARGRSPARK